MSFIPQEIIDEVISRNSIESVVGDYVQLEKRSGSNLFGLCPFHSEDTPSFSVTPAKNFFYCFGCQAGGNVVKFIQLIENLTFPDTIKFLAERVGMELDLKDDPVARKKQEEYKRMQACLLDAARFYYKHFISRQGESAQQYMIKKRRLSQQILTTFGVGFAPDEWSALGDFLQTKGYPEKTLRDLGLVRKSKRETMYDFFRNRVMFPVFDNLGKLIAFGGRTLGDDEAKYINSPDSRIYNKGKHLYALNFARRASGDGIILCEGYMDTIALHEAGFKNAVAGLGTALTQNQAKLLSHYTDRVVLAYDSDNAGQSAAQKAIPLFERENVEVSVLLLPEGQDPDDYLHEYGTDRFYALIKNALPALDYRFYMARKENLTDIGTLDIMAYQRAATDILSQINNAVVRELYTDKVAKELQVSPASIQQVVEGKRLGNQKLSVNSAISSSLTRKEGKRFVLESSAITYLAALIDDNSILKYKTSSASTTDFQEEIRELITKVLDRANNNSLSMPAFLSILDEFEDELHLQKRVLPYFARIKSGEMRRPEVYGAEALARMRLARLDEEKTELLLSIADPQIEPEHKKEILRRINAITVEINRMRNEV